MRYIYKPLPSLFSKTIGIISLETVNFARIIVAQQHRYQIFVFRFSTEAKP